MAVQLRNDQLTELLRGDFQSRYEPNFAHKSAAALLRGLPGLRGAWTMGSFDENGDQFDVSGQGRTLSYNGDPTYSYDDLAPYLDLDGTGDYLDRADEAALDITGSETYVLAASRGLAMGCWVYPTVVGATQDIIGKWDVGGGANQRSYSLRLVNTNVFRARITSDGQVGTLVTVDSTVAVAASAWYFVAMTYSPTAQSNRLAINVNGTITAVNANTASLHSGTANFVVGASDNGTANLLTGRVSLAWLCAMYHPDYFTEVLREQTRAMFGG